jgi:CRISPR-associated protein Cas1
MHPPAPLAPATPVAQPDATTDAAPAAPNTDATDTTAATPDDDAGAALIPARMLNEVVYCPRLFHLEHVAGEWDDNADTVSGKRTHRRVDASASALPDAQQLEEAGLRVARSVTAAAPAEGLVAKVDLVEAEGGQVTPVDYKRGSAPDPARVEGGVWPADRVQIGAQIMALRAAGYACQGGVAYYAASKTRVSVPFDDALGAEVRAAVAEARRLAAERTPPPPLVDSPKCPRCSLVGICLPDEVNLLRAEAPEAAPATAEPGADDDGDQPAAPDALDADDECAVETPQPDARPRVRRLLPADDDRRPGHVQSNGAVVGRDGDVLEARLRDGSKQVLRLRSLSHLSVYGQVQLTAGAVQALCSAGIGASFFSTGGWYYGALGGVATASVHTRLAQFEAAADPGRSLRLARAFVRGKILNCRTLLRRNAPEEPAAALARLKDYAADARRAASLESLLGIEGMAARIYFGVLAALLAPRSGGGAAFDFEGRNRRPPRDPVNALLSFAYALLVRDARIALLAAGFDPTVGFLHQPRPGRPALALDLMEEFRPLVADSVVLTAINTEIVQAGDFVHAAGAVALNERGRKAFLGAYERRLQQEITHPIFGYRVSYRRVLEVQARLLARALTGELADYPSFLTR